MRVLVFDGPEMKAGKERFGDKFHVYYQNLTDPTDRPDIFYEVDAPLGHEVPFDHVRLAETYVERGFASLHERVDEIPAGDTAEKE